jgi:hypothetical protein
MKNWNAQRTSLTERLADGSRYASGKTVEAADLSNFLQAVIRPGDRVCLEGDNQKQADVLAAALADIDPAKVHDLHMIQSGVVLPEHLDVFDKGVARRLDYSYSGPQAARIARMLFGGKIELGAVHTYLELFARYFIDLTPNVALIAAVSADKDGNLYTGPNTEDTPTLVETTTFKSGLVVAQVAEIVDRLPRVDIPGDQVHFVVEAKKPFFVEPLFTRDPAAITEGQILTAMLAIKGIYAPYDVKRLNHGIGFNIAAIELLLPTYGERLGLKGKVATRFALNPHPALIPAIESGWVEQIHSFGSKVGMDDYIRARSDIYFTGHDGWLRSNRAFCQVAGLYACDMFIGSTLQIDLQGKFFERHDLAHCRLRRRAEHGLRRAGTPPPERALVAIGQGGRSRRPGTSAARPQAGGADRRDFWRQCYRSKSILRIYTMALGAVLVLVLGGQFLGPTPMRRLDRRLPEKFKQGKVLFCELVLCRGCPIEAWHFCLGGMEGPALIMRVAPEASGPFYLLGRNRNPNAARGFQFEKPLAHGADRRLVE